MAKRKKTIRKVRSKTIGYLIAALGFFIALQLNTYINAIISKYFPVDNGNIIGRTIYIVVLLVAVVFVVIMLERYNK